MKTNHIIKALDAIDKRDLIVKIITKSRNSCTSRIELGKNTDFKFCLELYFKFFCYDKNKHPEAVSQKKITLIDFKRKNGESIQTTDLQKIMIENFFRNYIIPDIRLNTKSESKKSKNHIVTNHFAD